MAAARASTICKAVARTGDGTSLSSPVNAPGSAILGSGHPSTRPGLEAPGTDCLPWHVRPRRRCLLCWTERGSPVVGPSQTEGYDSQRIAKKAMSFPATAGRIGMRCCTRLVDFGDL
jgi:hypothetical protein